MVSSEAPTDCSPNLESSESSRVLSLGTSVVITPPFNNNGNSDNEKITGVDLGKQPSYVGLACCISGYTTLTTYNSKQREGFRSRDISPARITGISARKGDDGTSCFTGTNCLTVQPRYLTDMEHRSDIGGEKAWNRSINMTSSSKQSNGCTTSTLTNTSSMSVSESHFSSFSSTSSLSQTIREMKLSSESTPDKCSFILQRVERLYGPGALAQGFYTRHKTRYSPPSQENDNEESNRSDAEESLPVLRLLRPEFRAQLSLAKRKSSSTNLTAQRNNKSNGEVKERIIPIEIEQCQPVITNVPGERDGHYYLQMVCKEMETLQRLAAVIESELEVQNNVPEDISGRLRAAAGKARLLATQKLAQFQGLCEKNINQDLSEDFPTTCEDLAGFWDMVSIQISSVHEEFEKINKLKAAGWKSEHLLEDDKISKPTVSNGASAAPARRSKGNTPTSRKSPLSVNRNSPSSGSKKSPSSASKARDEERKRLIEERRKEMRLSNNTRLDDSMTHRVGVIGG